MPMHPRHFEHTTSGGKELFEKIPQRAPLLKQHLVPAAESQSDASDERVEAIVREGKANLVRSVCGPLVARGECDPAFFYAACRFEALRY